MSESSSRPVIEADYLGFGYPGGPLVFGGLSLSIREGERVGVVGANGAGKSTLLLLLAGVMAPRSGRLAVWGIESNGASLAAIRRSAGLVFQNPDDMLFMPTVRADVAFGPASRGLDGQTVDDRVRAALDAAGASPLAHRPPWELSGGEKRLASIAAVLALEPSILLLDEPSSGLDPASRRGLIELVPTLRGTLLIASHDLDLVLDLCDRVVVLGGGRVSSDGPAAEVLGDRALLAANRLELPLRLQACPRCRVRA
jgi:cobalt/nickel transport system ATP-binding protein